MSLFGSMLGDFEDDPIFGSHMQSMQHMNSMMSSMFGNPFGMMTPALMGPNGRGGDGHHNQMMPFGFPMGLPNMNDMFAGMNNMGSGPNGHGMSSMSMMTYTNGPDGRPQVYQASRSTRAAPGGIKETQETVFDSRTGTKKMAIGHHIGERAHVIEKQKNIHNGDEEEHQELINLDEEEVDTFNQEWQTRARGRSGRSDRAIEYSPSHHRKRPDPQRLALTDGGNTTTSTSEKPSSESETTKDEKQSSSTEPSKSRKRERTEEDETSNKRQMSNTQD
jgi:myeloid leukemia factor 1